MDESRATNPYALTAPTRFSLVMVKKGSLLLACYEKLFYKNLVNIIFIITCLSCKKLKPSTLFSTNEQTTNQPLSDNLRQQVSTFFLAAAHTGVLTRELPLFHLAL